MPEAARNPETGNPGGAIRRGFPCRRWRDRRRCAALLYTGALQAALRYDPTGRLYEVSGGAAGVQRFAYDGNALIAEYNAGGTMLRRYVHGSNAEADDPLVWYEGAAVSDAARRYLHADPRGSIVAVTNNQGTTTATNSYDAYGIPDTATGNDIATKGRFRYTGQMWIPELGMYHYKARVYSPTLGRFLQTDPIGYEDQLNLYAYVGNDPVNKVDPTGTSDLNLFHSTDTLWLAGWAFEPNGEDDSVFTITGHGSARGIVDNRDGHTKQYLTATELASEARANGLKQGMTAFLGSCNCATGNYARDFAIASKSTVIAANGFVMFPSARKGYRPDTYNGKVSLYVSQTRDGKGPRGQFLQYNSKGQVTKTWDRATFNAKTGRVTFSNDTPQTGTRIWETRSQCVSKELCGG